MGKKNNQFIEKVISSLDWDSILNVNKCFKIGIGEESSVIPGIKRKIFSDSITKNDIKNELKYLLNYVIDNDIPEIFYGPWMIYWVNADWAETSNEYTEEIENEYMEEMGESIMNTTFEQSSLEVIYSPQRIHIMGSVVKPETNQKESDITRLESMLKKSLDSENYEVASKIKELLALHITELTGDK
jgi:hypothetical protein